MTRKPQVGRDFPSVEILDSEGRPGMLARPGGAWHMIVVYRGAHCTRCITYLTRLMGLLPQFQSLGVNVLAVTSDPGDRAAKFLQDNSIVLPYATGLTTLGMSALGLFISDPVSEAETDQPFPEPGLFIVNPDGVLQVADISNSASFRPDLEVVLSGVTAMVTKGMPIRGLA